MTYCPDYQPSDLSVEQVASREGWLLLEFGSQGCGHCQLAQPAIAEMMAGQPALAHIKVADGRGQRLGRHFRVKLWPSLILLKDGKEVARAVRPRQLDDLKSLLVAIEKG